MRRRVNRVQYALDSKDVKNQPLEDIRAIIRGADDLIMSGGRNMLAKILKGSKDKKVLELKLNESPVYGYFSILTLEDILARIDWCIKEDYLAIEYHYRLPMLVYTEKGWEIEKDIYSDELLNKLNEMCFSKDYEYLQQLKERNRKVIWMLLDKIVGSGRKQFIPLLLIWKEIDYKKVKKRINAVIRVLDGSMSLEEYDDVKDEPENGEGRVI